MFPGLVNTNSLENQGFHPAVVSMGRFFGAIVAANADSYADVPVSKAVTGGGGLMTSGAYGWKVGLETWAQNEAKRKQLFEWALQKAQTAAKQNSAGSLTLL